MVLLTALGLIHSCTKKPLRVGEQTIQKLQEQLYAGQSKFEVEGVLNLLKIEYSFDPVQQQYIGIVRDVSSDGIIHTNLQIFITLGLKNQVTSIVERKIFTGP